MPHGLRTRDTRTAQISSLGVVGAPARTADLAYGPHRLIFDAWQLLTGSQGRFQLVILQEPTSRTNEELPHRRLKSVGAVGWSADRGGRPTAHCHQPPPILVFGLS